MAFITFFARNHSAMYQLDEEVVLGRSYDCDIFVPDVFVSRQHCRFEKTDRGWMVVDLGSRNGIYFNGTRVKRRELNHQDVVELGSVAFAFDDGGIITPETSTAMPYGQGTRISELIDTLYAGESRPAEYIRRKGRQPKSKSNSETEFEAGNEAVTVPEEEPSEWTELDVELQVAAMEAPAPRFNFLDEPISLQAAMETQEATGHKPPAQGRYRADRERSRADADKPIAVAAVPEADQERTVGYGGQGLWGASGVAPERTSAPANKRRIRRPKREPNPNPISLHQKLYDAVQEIMFRIRASPLLSAGIAGMLLILVITTIYFSNRRHIPAYDFDKMSDSDKFNAMNASAN